MRIFGRGLAPAFFCCLLEGRAAYMCLLRLISPWLRRSQGKPHKPFVSLTLGIPMTQSIQGQRYPEPLLCLLRSIYQ